MPHFLIADLSSCSMGADFDPTCVTVDIQDHSDGFPLVHADRTARVSPIFPVESSEAVLPRQSERYTIGFFSADNPFQVVAKLRAQVGEGLLSQLWYSHGYANLLVITESETLVGDVLAGIRNDLRAAEIWIIEDGKITEHWYTNYQIPTSDVDTVLPSYRVLPVSIRFVVDEFSRSVEHARRLAGLYWREELQTCSSILAAGTDLITELVYLHTLDEPVPSGLTYFPPQSLVDRPLDRESLIHQRVARIVQINSGLSYVMSQAYAGVVPILSRPSLVRRCSLLGVGTALRAVTRLARMIESAFSRYPIESVLLHSLTKLDPIPGYHNVTEHSPGQWLRFAPDQFFEDRAFPTSRGVPKLVYFSGRLGFRESEYSVSAGLQVLASGDTVTWNVITMTHEMLHGHVRDILAAVFAPLPGEPVEAARNRFISIFSRTSTDEGDFPERALDSLRNVLFQYCCWTLACGSLTVSTPEDVEKRATTDGAVIRNRTPEVLWRTLEQEFRNINEIIVHVLDFNYFYDARHDLYVRSLWRSWAAVPSVLSDLKQYLLRTLLAVASKLTGNVVQRFDQATKMVGEVFDTEPESSQSKPLVSRVCQMLGNRQLLWPFIASIQIVDLARHILFSGKIRAEFFNEDENVTFDDEGGVRYLVNSGEFLEPGVASPSAFLVDRLRRAVEQAGPMIDDEERLAAWSFLAFGSSPSPQEAR